MEWCVRQERSSSTIGHGKWALCSCEQTQQATTHHIPEDKAVRLCKPVRGYGAWSVNPGSTWNVLRVCMISSSWSHLKKKNRSYDCAALCDLKINNNYYLTVWSKYSNIDQYLCNRAIIHYRVQPTCGSSSCGGWWADITSGTETLTSHWPILDRSIRTV